MTDSVFQQEITSLRAKNSELLTELRGVKEKLREAQEANASNDERFTSVQRELIDIKTKEAWAESWQAAGVTPELAKYARQELSHDLSVDAKGNIIAVCKLSGEPVTDDRTGELLDAKQVLKDQLEALRTTHASFFPRPQGSSAPGNSSSYARPAFSATKETPAKAKPLATGLR